MRTAKSDSKERQTMNEALKIPEVGTGYDEQRAIQPVTPMSLIEIAVGQNADVDKLAKLMDLQLRWEANEAKKAFVSAMNAFKANPPEILKNHLVSYEARGQQVSYKHATLDHVCDAVTEALSKQGISHRWRLEQTGAEIRVTCILTHEMGHSEETTLMGGPDDTGSKNKIQSISSTVTYLERYTLLAATGLAAKGDDDGRLNEPAMDTLQVHLDRIVGSENMKQLDNAFKDAFKEATALKNTRAMLAIMTAKDNRKRELQKDEPKATVGTYGWEAL